MFTNGFGSPRMSDYQTFSYNAQQRHGDKKVSPHGHVFLYGSQSVLLSELQSQCIH